ncbi:O-antigen ligase family protein [Pseudoalteromonas sp. bablab_jr004]|uniref:O-antigen ligase family protein n=1 Tax=Pseudoalteromonas sp. bablab_jr004 TaxID=2755065 RepID=UPI0018F7812D|nr:O-antigen ligase family protein [Pseudoalteromonas sp. bablab_jr004]
MKISSFSSCINGFLIALLLERHAIAVISGMGPSFAGLISVISFLGICALFMFNIKKPLYKFGYSSFFLSILAFFIFIYSLISTVINGENDFGLLFELLALLILFFVGKALNVTAFNCMAIFCIIISTVLSVYLIVDRGYIFSSGVNYLLVSIPIGTCFLLSLCLSINLNNVILRLLLIVSCIISFTSLFYLQSRAVFLTVIAFSCFIYFYISKDSFLSYKNIVLTSILILFFTYESHTILNFYENSSLFNRLNAFFSGNSHEPRSELYSNYFGHLNEFYFSGFGLGGTESGLYTNTVEKYPHNLILEFWSEFGLLGLIFSITFTLISIKRSYFLLLNHKDSLIVVVLYLFFLMNFMKSFSIYQSSVFFLFLGLLFNHELGKGSK